MRILGSLKGEAGASLIVAGKKRTLNQAVLSKLRIEKKEKN